MIFLKSLKTGRSLVPGIMFTIDQAPVEIWLQIFEHLELKDLIQLHTACGTLWSPLIARAAAKVIGSFLVDGNPIPLGLVECSSLPYKHSLEINDPPHIFNFAQSLIGLPCSPLSLRCYSHGFERHGGLSEMNLELVCNSRCSHYHGNDFHPCENGPEPAEIMTFITDFTPPPTSSEDKRITVRFVYNTLGTTPLDHITEKVDDDGQIIRVISHKLNFFNFLYSTSSGYGKPLFPSGYGYGWKPLPPSRYGYGWKPLPHEWVNFLDPEVLVSMTFTRDPPVKSHPGYFDRSFRCIVSKLTAFKAIWNFKWVPSEEVGRRLDSGDRREFNRISYA